MTTIKALYGERAEQQRARFENLAQSLRAQGHPDGRIRFFSAPGRTELGGNHTDHQNGHVLAAAVDIDMAAAAIAVPGSVIRMRSEGFAPICVDLRELSPQPEEAGSSAALVRGVAAALIARGYPVGGFELAMDSQVPPGSGLSSSAAFEILLGTVMNGLFCGGAVDPVTLAQIGQWAENVYFDKPCGLMDQMACSVGGAVAIDLKDPQRPVLRRMQAPLEAHGYALAILRCGDDHADLTDEYGAIPRELGALAAYFGETSVLRLDRARVLQELPALRRAVGDRAILRTFHVWADDERVPLQARALERGDFQSYLELVRKSGESSWMYLQNVVAPGSSRAQGLAFTLALCRQLLGEKGACRVHGGGFAGTAQAYVPLAQAESFRRGIDAALGEGACMLVGIRPVGGTELCITEEETGG